MLSDFRFILRGFARTPLFTFAAVLSLALGIGANTAMFSLLHQIVLRTLPVKNPAELAFFYDDGPVQGSYTSDEDGGPSFSYPMFRELQKRQTPFTGIAAMKNDPASLSYKGHATSGVLRLVSGNYFELLGVQPAIGRLFAESDDNALGAHPVAVLSFDYWTERFGSDPGALNQKLVINGYPFTIVGVAQKGFLGELQGRPPDAYVPITMREVLLPEWKGFTNRRDYWVTMFGRLKPGMTLKRAQLEVNVPYRAQIEEDIPLLKRPKPDFLARFKAKQLTLKSGEHGRGDMREERRQPLLLVMGLTGLVLLIACANVANLQLARSAARAREVSVRLALGASRWQLVRQLLLESCLLAFAGGGLGLLASKWTFQAALASVPERQNIAGFVSSEISFSVLLFCFALSIATGLLFGLIPALQSSKPDLIATLKNQAGQITSTSLFRKALVTAQIAISLLLLISAGLFARTLVNLHRVELGIQTDHLMTFSLTPRLNRYNDAQAGALHRQLAEKLAAIPGVRLVTVTDIPAIAGWRARTSMLIEGFHSGSDDGSVAVNITRVGPDYFRTVGTALVAGREFAASDNTTAPKVAIVNEEFVRRYFPNQNPIGRHVGRSGDNAKLDVEIVGVVKGAKYANLKEPTPSVVYYAYGQETNPWQTFYYLRTAIEPAQTASAIRQRLAELDSNLPVREMKTMDEQIRENVFNERLMSTLTGSFAGLATILAAIGLYGVLAFNVARRTREIGIRMALGARLRHVRGLVVGEVLWMVGIGCVIGIGSAAAAGRLLQSYLFGMKAWDVFVYTSAALVLCAIAIAAAYVPARRASNVDPMVALRYE